MKSSLGKPILVSTFLFVVVLVLNSSRLTTSVTSYLEVENQNEFDYCEGSSKGPDRWGDLKPEWAKCKNGTMQSPIDLADCNVKVVPALGRLQKRYKPANAILKNRGHDISLQWVSGTAGSITIGGIDYALEQCHWHSPSEHTINGRRFALELHMVHRNARLGKIAVIGILYQYYRKFDPFISELTSDILKISGTGNDQVNVGMVDPNHITMGSEKYYRYMGSLTTPPCTEGIIWTINNRIGPVAISQVKLLRNAVHDYAETNARPLQPLNNRDILFYSPMYIETLPFSLSHVIIVNK